MKTKKILILYSRTGGGHFSVAEALEGELKKQRSDLDVTIADPWSDSAPAPLNKWPAWYPYMVRSKTLWQAFYEITDTKISAKILKEAYSTYARSAMKKLLQPHYDLIVATHFGYNFPVLDQLEKNSSQTPYITVVTDYITGHRLWFDERADLCIVPSREIQDYGLENGMNLEQMPICGLPLKPEFEKKLSKKAAEKMLEWRSTKKLRLLLIGGGEGMGKLAAIAKALNKRGLKIELIAVAGKNTALREKLEGLDWQIDHKILGYSDQIATIMSACDIIITKGGPTSILEAATLEKPLIVYDYLPGQEEGNILAVLSSGAGQLITEPDQVAKIIERYVKHPRLLKNFVAGTKSLSQTGAREKATKKILEYL